MPGSLVADNGVPSNGKATNLTQKLDQWHSSIFGKLNGYVEHTDQLFAKDGEELKRVTNSTFTAELYIELTEEGSPGIKVNPSLSGDLYLPNLEERFHVFIDNISPDEMPDSDPMQRKTDFYAGARKVFDVSKWPIDASAGIKWRWPPVLFGELDIKKKFTPESWLFYPKQSFYWFSDDGFGTKFSYTMDKWIGKQWVNRSVSALKWSETTKGIEWSQSLTTGYLAERDSEDILRGIGARLVIAGHKSGSGIIDRYRTEILSRVPLYKKWILVSITPRVEWANVDNWDSKFSLLFTFNFYFWGGDER
jgi:hypothetical protein